MFFDNLTECSNSTEQNTGLSILELIFIVENLSLKKSWCQKASIPARDIEILGSYPAGSVLPHGKKVPL